MLLILSIVLGPIVEAKEEAVNFAVTGALSAQSGAYVFQKMAKYVSIKTGLKINVVTNLSYSGVNLALKNGDVQIAAICGMPYVQQKEQLGLRLMATPAMKLDKKALQELGIESPGYAGHPGKYFSYTIVQKNSNLKNWADLKGKTFAVPEVKSNSGYNMPRMKLAQMKFSSWSDYFSKVIISGTHENAIRLVAVGKVDAANVASLILDYQLLHNEKFAKSVRVIETLGPSSAPPFVAGSSLSEERFKKIQGALLGMDSDSEGRTILNELYIQKLLPPDDAAYDDIRAMINSARSANFKDIE